MLATMILDTYRMQEAKQVSEALADICSRNDTYGFSSAAIYAFWSIKPRDILYIGLANDITRRFGQHNGLVKCKPSSCKFEQIKKHFQANDRIGYTILVQSTLDQPLNKAEARKLAAEEDDAFARDVQEVLQGQENVEFAEGLLIRLYQKLGGNKPRWNKKHGAKRGQGAPSTTGLMPRFEMTKLLLAGKSRDEAAEQIEKMDPPYHYLEELDGSHLTDFNAKCTIRELAADSSFCSNEEFLHGVRCLMLPNNLDFEASLNNQLRSNPYAQARLDFMKSSGYLNRVLLLPGVD